MDARFIYSAFATEQIGSGKIIKRLRKFKLIISEGLKEKYNYKKKMLMNFLYASLDQLLCDAQLTYTHGRRDSVNSRECFRLLRKYFCFLLKAKIKRKQKFALNLRAI